MPGGTPASISDIAGGGTRTTPPGGHRGHLDYHDVVFIGCAGSRSGVQSPYKLLINMLTGMPTVHNM
jgi:hypothetical protein